MTVQQSERNSKRVANESESPCICTVCKLYWFLSPEDKECNLLRGHALKFAFSQFIQCKGYTKSEIEREEHKKYKVKKSYLKTFKESQACQSISIGIGFFPNVNIKPFTELLSFTGMQKV